jgi:Tol biopolymer transport system component
LHTHIYVGRADGASVPQPLTSDGDGADSPEDSPTWSPDGSKIAFVRREGVHFVGQVYVVNADGTGLNKLCDGTSKDQSPSWGPFPASRTFVGTGGSMAPAASGFLVAQKGKVNTSLVVFNAQTPNSAHLDAQGTTLPTQPNLVFNLSGDQLTNLVYLNGLNNTPTTVLNASSTANGAVVSFDASDGTVTGVFPYTASRAEKAGQATSSGGTLIYRGSFLGVWDGQGMNRAPGGASEIRIDARTGHLIAFR